MSQDDLAERLDAVERRLDAAYPEPTEGAVDSGTIERVEGFAERLADLEAAVEAVEGYVGEIERVDDALESRADAALAAADGLEDRVDSIEAKLDAAPAQRAPAVDDRLAEQTAALEELRSEIGSLDDRVAAIESDATEADPVGHAHENDGRSHRCTCAEPNPGERDGDGTAFGTRRSAADGGFERPTRTAAAPTDTTDARQAAGLEATDGPGIETEPRASGGDPGRNVDRTDPPGHLSRDPGSHDPASRNRTTSPRSAGGPSSVSGWGDGPNDSPQSADSRAGEVPADPAAVQSSNSDDDRDWTDAESETLLDRLRSLL